MMRRTKKPAYSTYDLSVGTKHEMEHTKDRKVARQIATDHLKEHPTYYRVLPMAEQLMSLQENKKAPKKRKRPTALKPTGAMYGGTPWD